MRENLCVYCNDRPTVASWLCSECRALFGQLLGQLPAMRELATDALIKRQGAGTPGGGAATVAYCPVDLSASEVLSGITEFERRCWSLLGSHGTTARLVRLPSVLALRPEVGDRLRELVWLSERVRRLGVPAAERIGLGPCPECGASVYAPAGAPVQACDARDGCGALLNVPVLLEARQERINAAMAAEHADLLLTPAAISAATLGGVTAARVRQWAHRGKLTAHDGPGGKRLYRLGDVLDLVGAK